MRAYVAITDREWFDQFRSLPCLDEVNFWLPTRIQHLKSLDPGDLFLFRLHYPHSYIVGGNLNLSLLAIEYLSIPLSSNHF
jgi:putative restriction endonuclease